MNKLRRLFHALMQFASTWWKVDRIRIARSEGRLLHIQAGQELLIGNVTYEVVCVHSTVSDEVARFSIGMVELETDRRELCYLEHAVTCSQLAIRDDEPWRLIYPHGDCVEIDSDCVICYSRNSN